MNLTALRQKIKNITDYSPELQQYNEQLDDLINDAYYSIYTKKRWNFTTKLAIFDFYPDITPARDNEGMPLGAEKTITIASGSRKVVFFTFVDRLVSQRDVWEGAIIELNNQEYIINYIDVSGNIQLTEEYRGEDLTDSTAWKIKKRYYDLPQDCSELLYVGHRDYPYTTVSGMSNPYGKSSAILPSMEERLNMRVDYDQPYAEAYINSPTVQIKPAERLEIRDGETGTLPNNTYWEFCYAFVKDGKIGPLSEPSQVHTHGNNGSVILKFMSWNDEEIFSDGFYANDKRPTQWEGYRKVIFFNKNLDRKTGEHKGLHCWVQVTKGGSRGTNTYLEPLLVSDEDFEVTIDDITQLDSGNERYIERDGLHQQIRFYPRVNGYDIELPRKTDFAIITQFHNYVRQGIMRYMKKPQDLLLGTDVPDMPVEFHQLIVYKALEDIYLKLGQIDMARIYEKKYETEVKGLEKRYVDKIDFQVQRGQFSMGQRSARFDISNLHYRG
jgi:hypothetical protein